MFGTALIASGGLNIEAALQLYIARKEYASYSNYLHPACIDHVAAKPRSRSPADALE